MTTSRSGKTWLKGIGLALLPCLHRPPPLQPTRQTNPNRAGHPRARHRRAPVAVCRLNRRGGGCGGRRPAGPAHCLGALGVPAGRGGRRRCWVLRGALGAGGDAAASLIGFIKWSGVEPAGCGRWRLARGALGAGRTAATLHSVLRTQQGDAWRRLHFGSRQARRWTTVPTPCTRPSTCPFQVVCQSEGGLTYEVWRQALRGEHPCCSASAATAAAAAADAAGRLPPARLCWRCGCNCCCGYLCSRLSDILLVVPHSRAPHSCILPQAGCTWTAAGRCCKACRPSVFAHPALTPTVLPPPTFVLAGGLYMYRSRAVFEGVSPRDLRPFHLDDHAR